MSNKINDQLMDTAIEIVEERVAKNNIPEEAKKMLIKEVYEDLLTREGEII